MGGQATLLWHIQTVFQIKWSTKLATNDDVNLQNGYRAEQMVLYTYLMVGFSSGFQENESYALASVQKAISLSF